MTGWVSSPFPQRRTDSPPAALPASLWWLLTRAGASSSLAGAFRNINNKRWASLLFKNLKGFRFAMPCGKMFYLKLAVMMRVKKSNKLYHAPADYVTECSRGHNETCWIFFYFSIISEHYNWRQVRALLRTGPVCILNVFHFVGCSRYTHCLSWSHKSDWTNVNKTCTHTHTNRGKYSS